MKTAACGIFILSHQKSDLSMSNILMSLRNKDNVSKRKLCNSAGYILYENILYKIDNVWTNIVIVGSIAGESSSFCITYDHYTFYRTKLEDTIEIIKTPEIVTFFISN